MKIELGQEIVEKIFQKILNLDFIENQSLDIPLATQFQKESLQYHLPLDKDYIFQNIRNQSYFILINGDLLSYDEFRHNWHDYRGPDKEFDLSGKRQEFLLFLTNRFKNRWVSIDGTPLPVNTFQLLYKLEREPKAMERILNFLERNFFNFVDPEGLNSFLNQMRRTIAKLIKEHFHAFFIQ